MLQQHRPELLGHLRRPLARRQAVPKVILNLAFDAGYAAALGKSLIILHGPHHAHDPDWRPVRIPDRHH